MAAFRRFLLLCAGFIIMVWTIYLMSSPIKYVLGFVLLLITFVVGELLLGEYRSQTSTKINAGSTAKAHILVEWGTAFALIVSLTLVYFIPSIEGSLYSSWADLGLLNILRLGSAFALNFLPGYLVLSILGKRAPIHGLAKLLAAYFFSLFLLTIVGFVTAHISGIIDNFFVTVFISVNAGLIAVRFAQILYGWLRSKSSGSPALVPFSRFLLLPAFLLLLTIAFKYVWFAGMFEKTGFFIGGPGSDMWRHHGYVQSFLDGRAFLWLHTPWWFYLYLAGFTVLSGVPSINAYLALYPLVILSTLSFYVMVSAFFEDKKTPAIATLAYTAFSGFAWVYAFSMRGFGPVVDSASWTSILYETGSKFLYQGWYPPFTIGFVPSDVAYAGLWLLVFATRRLNTRSFFGIFFIGIVSAMSYLIHGADLIIFVVFLGALLAANLLTRDVIGRRRVRWASISVLIGILIITVIDLSLTKYYASPLFKYVWSQTTYYYFNSPGFQVAVAMAVAILILSFVHVKPAAQQFMLKLPKVANYSLVISGIVVYGLSLALWIHNLPSFNLSGDPFSNPVLGSVPWYAYSGVGGIPFLLALAAAGYLALRWKKLESSLRDPIAFCCFAVVLLYFLGRMVSFVNENFFYTGFWERRVMFYVYPVTDMLAAFALVIFFERVICPGLYAISSHISSAASSLTRVKWSVRLKKVSRSALTSLLLSLILVSSVSSTLIAQDFIYNIARSPPITKAELEALTYLHYSLPSSSKAAYLNKRSGTEYIRAFANDKWTYDARQWWGARSPQFPFSSVSIISSVGQLNIEFLYFNRIRDADDLERNFFLQQLVSVLPIVFNNTEVTIYSIPPLRQPSPFSSLGIIPLDEQKGASYDAARAHDLWLFTLMMGGSPYSVITNSSDPDVLNASRNIVLTYDPPPFEEGVAPLLEWVAGGGNLILSNTNPYGISADLFGLMSKTSLVDCDSADNWSTFYGRGQISVEDSVKIEGTGSLRMQNNLSKWEEWIYTPSLPWNFSQSKYLGISVYQSGLDPNGSQWKLYLTDSNNNTQYYRYDLSVYDYQDRIYVPRFSGWKQLLIPIRDYFGDLDLSSVKELRLLTGYLLPVSILIDDVFALRETGIERSTVLANGIGGSVSVALPEVEVEDFSWSGDAKVIANYTRDAVPVAPFALQKDYGSGKITYLNMNLLYQSIISERTEFISPYEILVKVLEMVSI